MFPLNIKIQWFQKIVCEIEKKEHEKYNVMAVGSTGVDSDFIYVVSTKNLFLNFKDTKYPLFMKYTGQRL